MRHHLAIAVGIGVAAGLACASGKDSGNDATNTGDTDSETGIPIDGDELKIPFTGWVATVANTPLGFDDSVRDTEISGYFTYDPDIPDDDAEAHRGSFPHYETARFHLEV